MSSLKNKLEQAMEGLIRCRNLDGQGCLGCPYNQDGYGDCLDRAIRDALEVLEKVRGMIMK